MELEDYYFAPDKAAKIQRVSGLAVRAADQILAAGGRNQVPKPFVCLQFRACARLPGRCSVMFYGNCMG